MQEGKQSIDTMLSFSVAILVVMSLTKTSHSAEELSSEANTAIGINIAFLVHNKQDTGSSNVALALSITDGFVNYVKAKYGRAEYSPWLSIFSDNASVPFANGSSWNSKSAEQQAEDILKELKHMAYQGIGTNISGALLTAQQFFNIHQGNRNFAPNLCIILTMAPSDNRSLSAASAKSLQDMGVSIIVIAIGEDVRKEDVEELASNTNAVFTARVNDTTANDVGKLIENITISVISEMAQAVVLPRFSLCYQSYIDFVIIVDITKNHISMVSEITEFVAQFYLKRVSMKVIIINGPITDDNFINSYKEMVNKKQGIKFEVHGSRYNMSSTMDCVQHYFLENSPGRNYIENIRIIVTDRIYENLNDVICEARECRALGIHLMALGVGKNISQDQLNKIISDPTGIVMVEDTEDIFCGLQALNRQLCPAVCDRGWIYHEDMCYYYSAMKRKTWVEAKAQCKTFNSKLVSITSRSKLDWLSSTFSQKTFPIYIGLRKYDQGNAPITSHLKWENEKPLVLTNWSTLDFAPQPDGGMYEACVTWYEGGWTDIGCSVNLPFGGWICEREAGNKTKSEIKGVTMSPFWKKTQREPIFQSLEARGTCSFVNVSSSKEYELHTYNCSNGELISKYLLCDRVEDCRDGSDEVGCASTCEEAQYQCDNDRCVSLAFVCDYWDDCGDSSDETHCVHPRCPNNNWQCASGQCVSSAARCDLFYDCYDKTDEERCGDTCGQTLCYDGTCIPDSWRRDGIVDCNGVKREDEVELPPLDLCYDGNHLANEEYKDVRPNCTMVFDGFGKHYNSYSDLDCDGSAVCPSGFYLCPRTYCIPIERVCDGTKDCMDGEDEIGCAEYVCPGYFRCPGASYCLHPSRLCDGEVDCPGGKDEVLCGVKCPNNCFCDGGLVTCQNITLYSLFNHTRKLVIINQHLAFKKNLLTGMRYLTEAIFRETGLATVLHIFKDQVNLQRLDISKNEITYIPENSLSQLRNLIVLDLSNNRLESISEKTFFGLNKLKELHMRYTSIRVLKENSFSPLVSLVMLDLTGNNINSVSAGAFRGLSSLRILYMKYNYIDHFEQGIYDGLDHVEEIHTEVFTLCCPQVRPASIKENKCFSNKASISSCSDLMGNDFLRASIWILCISSLIGNIISTAMRILWEKNSMKIGFGVFVTHLGVSDFLMGIYLLIIAVADTRFKGVYIWKDHDWRESYYCKVAGFLATLSSEASTLFIFLITLDRILVMKFPFGQIRFRFRSATACSVVAWITAIVIAGIPLLPPLTSWHFYSKNGACLALPFFTERRPGWMYSAIIFIGLNFATFILIVLGQFIIYRTMKGSMISTKQRLAQDMVVARRLLLIVSTDFLCWFPIGVIGLLALSGTTVGGEVYAWTAVFVLPVNSALNPFLYTIPAVLQKMRTGDPRGRNKNERNNVELSLQKNVSSVTVVDDLDPHSNMVLLEDMLTQLKPNKDRRRLLRMMLKCLDENTVVLRSEQPPPNAIYVSMNGKNVNRICITTKRGHRGCEITSLILSLLTPD